MSKQVALVIDNSGSMFAPVGGANANSKIHEAAEGSRQFIDNLIDRLASTPGSEFALSVHRFASSYQLLPGGGQVSGSAPALTTMRGQIAQIEDEAASQSAIGSMTDLYDGVRRTSDYMIANNPSFGAPDSRVLVLFSDGIQTIQHGGGLSKANYEAATGQTFGNLLSGRGIKFIGWGVGTDALGTVLAALHGDGVAGSTSKVLFPYGAMPNCTTTILSAAHAIVDDNGILPLRPTWRPASGLLWEQFSLPRPSPAQGIYTHIPMTNEATFETDVDGITSELILSLVGFRPGRPSLSATSPSGAVFTQGSAGTRSLMGPTVRTLKIENPEPGTWRVLVQGSPGSAASTYDLMARGVSRKFVLSAHASPDHLPGPGKVKVVAVPQLDGKALKGKFKVTGHVLGGAGPAVSLDAQADGSFSDNMAVGNPGRNPIRIEVKGTLENGASIERVEYAVVQVGPALDPRFEIVPSSYEQGASYTVNLRLHDGEFTGDSSLRVGTGINVTRFQVLSAHLAEADIQVASDAFVGTREAVLFAPMAESAGVVSVGPGRGGHGTPPGTGHHQGRICCLRFDAHGKLIGVVLCDGPTLCVHHDDRVQRLLEYARDHDLSVTIHVDAKGCLVGVDICK
jgi:hypothetical protein